MRPTAFLFPLALLGVAARPAAAQCDRLRLVPSRDSAAASPYGESAEWYRNDEPITVYGSRYVNYGLPRTISAGDVWLIAEYEGVPVYAERGVRFTEVVYVLANGACELQPYQSNHSVYAVRADTTWLPGAPVASLMVSGCPAGAEMFIFPAQIIAEDPNWRSKLVAGSSYYMGEATYQRVKVFTATPRPYDVVLSYRGQAWRFRVDAIPGRETQVHARPPGRRRCEVPVYPVM